jgi:hypothetical protein
MNLKLIPAHTCPTCGAHTVTESIRAVHTNGEGFERREFACGCCLAWSPNFGRLEIASPCPKDPDVVSLRAKRTAAKDRTKEFLDTLDVDSHWRNLVSRHLESIH